MTPLEKLARDTERYLEILSQTGPCCRLDLLLMVDYWVVVFHRLQELVITLPWGVHHFGRIFIWCAKPFVEGMTGARIRSGAKIGSGFVVFNSFGVAIAANAVIADDCTIYSGVIVANKGNDKGNGSPLIGNRVTLMSGSKVLGGVVVGDGVIIGANSVVLKDIPKDTIAIGIPADIIKNIV